MSCANNIRKLVNVLVVSYSRSYLPLGPEHHHPHRHRTRLILLSCLSCRMVQHPTVSDELRAALTMSRRTQTYLSHLTCCRRHRQGPACHPHQRSTCYILLVIIHVTSYGTASCSFGQTESCANNLTKHTNILVTSYSRSDSLPDPDHHRSHLHRVRNVLLTIVLVWLYCTTVHCF